MADPRRVAAALQYQQRLQDPFDAVPVADPLGTVRVPAPPQLSLMDRAENLTTGLARGVTNQLEGYRQFAMHPVQSAVETAQALGTMAKNPSVVVDALKAMGAKASSGSQGLGEVIGENVTLNPQKLAKALSDPMMHELTVYHGTPYKFDKFDSSKIGTGEGAQAYGHGLYFAESPAVAGQYKNAFLIVDKETGQKIPDDTLGLNHLRYAANTFSGVYEKDVADKKTLKLLTELRDAADPNDAKRLEYDAAISLFEKTKAEPAGSLYTVDLPDEKIERMLDWDKPWEKQSDFVKKALKDSGLWKKYRENLSDFSSPMATRNKVMRGENIQSFVEYLSGGNSAKASEMLRQLGIPGIKYMDAGSRGQSRSGTRNFVVFPGEEEALTILERK